MEAFIIVPGNDYGPGGYTGNVIDMDYSEVYNLYRRVVGKNSFVESFLDAWDGFMSWTQLPRQFATGEEGPAESASGHVADFAVRVFSPVIAPVALGYFGVEKLKEKVRNAEAQLTIARWDVMEDYRKRLANVPNEDEKYRNIKDYWNIMEDNVIPDQDKIRMFENKLKREIEENAKNKSLDDVNETKSEKQK
jgi:hypothetical protein